MPATTPTRARIGLASVDRNTGAGYSDRGHCKSLPDIAPALSLVVVVKFRITLVALKQNIIDS